MHGSCVDVGEAQGGLNEPRRKWRSLDDESFRGLPLSAEPRICFWIKKKMYRKVKEPQHIR